MTRAYCPICYGKLNCSGTGNAVEVWCACGYTLLTSEPVTKDKLSRKVTNRQAVRGPDSKPLFLEG